MARIEITLRAAIADTASPKPDVRNIAVRNLAAALLGELGDPGPRWLAAADHEHGPRVLELLRQAASSDPELPIRGLAMVGLGQLGDPTLLDDAARWLENEGDAEHDVFLRECAVIATSFVGAVAPETAEGAPVRARVLHIVRGALRSPRPELRFQAGLALAEVGGRQVESELVAALRREPAPQVREHLVRAISTYDPPRRATCDLLQEIVDGGEGPEAIGFEAAMTLAAARLPGGGPRLVAALSVREHRDRALEALAALGDLAPPDAAAAIHRLARGWLTPAITRVRAAYALARLAPEDGIRILARLAFHPRFAVREAVADARRGLAELRRSDSK